MTTTAAKAKPIERVDMEELEAILEQAKKSLSAEQHRKLKAAVETLAYLSDEIADKKASIRRLRKLLFGPTDERKERVLDDDNAASNAREDTASNAGEDAGDRKKKKRKRKGHGRNGSKEYVGAKTIEVPHESISPGDACPKESCARQGGKVYRVCDPERIVRIEGRAPLGATIFERERLRCNLCGGTFKAKLPEGVGEEKYDATAVSMMANLRYGSGLPLNRLEKLQASLGIPLPASTQWDVVNKAAPVFSPVYEELIRQAAQGEVLHNDDTGMKILELMKEDRERRERGEPPDRTGIFTSGIVSVREERRVALFMTGREHAGENLGRVLAERDRELEIAIQMCDALSRNVSADFATIVCHCMSHARRQYVDVVEDFPEECRFVLETLAEVFKNDATARKEGMTAEERLEFHRRESKRVMAKLRLWMYAQLEKRLVEPNSGLGQAIAHMQKNWRTLTRFLFVAGAPLENNLCERMLKKAICHRKNSLFYKTQHGARVGDIYMSLIATCQLAKVNPFDYLTELQRNSEAVAANPTDWLPWNYRDTLARLGSNPS